MAWKKTKYTTRPERGAKSEGKRKEQMLGWLPSKICSNGLPFCCANDQFPGSTGNCGRALDSCLEICLNGERLYCVNDQLPGSADNSVCGRSPGSRLKSCRSDGQILFGYLFHPCVSAVAWNSSQSLPKVQVAGYSWARTQPTYVVSNKVTLWTGAWLSAGVHRTCAKRATVSCDTKHVTTEQHCKYTVKWI